MSEKLDKVEQSQGLLVVELEYLDLDRLLYQMSNNIVGRLKTWADATYSDQVQRKAVKDVLSQVVWTEREFQERNIRDQIFTPEYQKETEDKPNEEIHKRVKVYTYANPSESIG